MIGCALIKRFSVFSLFLSLMKQLSMLLAIRLPAITKHLCDQLHAAGTKIYDDDFIIAALNDLPPEYDMIKTISITCDTPISFKDFRAQLLAVEQTAEAQFTFYSAMFEPHTFSGYGIQGAQRVHHF